MTDDLIHNFTTYETQFSATLMQTDPMILSDTFDIKIDFAWASGDLAKGNSSFLKMKYFHQFQLLLIHQQLSSVQIFCDAFEAKYLLLV